MGMLVILLGFMVATTTFEGFLSHGGSFNHLSLKKKKVCGCPPILGTLKLGTQIPFKWKLMQNVAETMTQLCLKST